jgi:hypothetical protein
MNTIPVTGIKCMSQEYNSCHKDFIHVKGTHFLSKENISSYKKICMSQGCETCPWDAFEIIRIKFLPD